MEKSNDQIYQQGYRAGYRDGLAAGLSGKTEPPELLGLPVEALGLSARARNCLCACGCQRVADVAQLPEAAIRRMRGLGKKPPTRSPAASMPRAFSSPPGTTSCYKNAPAFQPGHRAIFGIFR